MLCLKLCTVLQFYSLLWFYVCSFLISQVERRELEISRLVTQLKGGRPPEALVAEASRESSERMTAHLNIQVDYLQQANQELASQLEAEKRNNAEMREQVDDLSSKNSRICVELKVLAILHVCT